MIDKKTLREAMRSEIDKLDLTKEQQGSSV